METLSGMAIALMIVVGSIRGQNASPCSALAEFRQLDFWIGEWDVKNPEGKIVGKSSIGRIVGDCVIFENYTSTRGPYEGKSFNIYNRQQGKWQQFWVDNQGDVLEFAGAVTDNRMQYEGVSKDSAGNDLKHIMTLTQMKDKSVLQVWDQSTDGGKTWKTVFNGLYVPRKEH